MSKTYFGNKSLGRLPAPEKLDPFDVVLCGVDPQSESISAESPEMDAIVRKLTMPSNIEVRAFLSDPNEFFRSWPQESQRVYMLGLLEHVLLRGSNLKPIVAEKHGDHILVADGRHNVAAIRVATWCLAGNVRVDAVTAIVATIRKERGLDWRPILTASQPAKSAETGEAIDPETVAMASQIVRTLSLPEMYDLAMRRIRAARAQESKPDFRSIGRDLGKTPNTIEGWEKLSSMPEPVRRAVLVGDAISGRTFPLSSALALSGMPEAEMIAKVAAMMEAGDTRVETAKAVARARNASDGRTDDASKTAASPNDGTDVAQGETTDTGGGRRADASDAVGSDDLPAPPWKKREFKKFFEAVPATRGQAWDAFRVASLLATQGPSAITSDDFHALGAFGDALREYLNERS